MELTNLLVLTIHQAKLKLKDGLAIFEKQNAEL